MTKSDVVLIGLAVVEHGLNLCVHAYVLIGFEVWFWNALMYV